MTINLKETVTAAIAAGTATAASDPNSNVTHSDVPAVIAAAQAAAAPAVQEAQARIDYITNNENPFASWGNNAAALSIVGGIYGMIEALSDGFQATDDRAAMITGAMSLIAAAGWIIGRFRGKPIGQ